MWILSIQLGIQEPPLLVTEGPPTRTEAGLFRTATRRRPSTNQRIGEPRGRTKIRNDTVFQNARRVYALDTANVICRT
jgi:hypothetical protein